MTRGTDGTDGPARSEPASAQAPAPHLRVPDGTDGLGGLALAGLGFQFAVSLVVCYYLGQWLDRRFGTAPVFLLATMVVGAGASFYYMYAQLMAVQRRVDAARAARGTAGRDRGARSDGSQ